LYAAFDRPALSRRLIGLAVLSLRKPGAQGSLGDAWGTTCGCRQCRAKKRVLGTHFVANTLHAECCRCKKLTHFHGGMPVSPKEKSHQFSYEKHQKKRGAARSFLFFIASFAQVLHKFNQIVLAN
jgi:hypothetical protein